MKLRIMMGLVGVPLVLAIMLVFPPFVLTMAVMAISALAAFELLGAVGLSRNRRLLILSVGCALVIPVWATDGRLTILMLILSVFAAFLFGAGMMDRSITFAGVCGAFFSGVFPALTFSSLITIFALPNGRLLVLSPFVVAWMSDALAYFGGRMLGRHQLAPSLSPKKTIEGAIAGLAGAVAGLAVFGIVFGSLTDLAVDFPRLYLIGITGGIVSQFGDLAFSYIKRQYGVKDFGSILPGHGGILDRFDSIVFVAPLMLFFLNDFPFFAK